MSAVVTTREIADSFDNGIEYFNTLVETLSRVQPDWLYLMSLSVTVYAPMLWTSATICLLVSAQCNNVLISQVIYAAEAYSLD